MRVLLFANNWVGWKIAEFLREQRDTEIVGLVLHPQGEQYPANQQYGKEIARSVGLNSARMFDALQLKDPEILRDICALKPDIGISAFFGYILEKDCIDLFPNGCINIHPALLPFNRGKHPNVWSIIERTPSGVTMHYIDAGIDTGAIISQKEVQIEPIDTGETLYRKLEWACIELFQETWPMIVSNQVSSVLPAKETGTHHYARELKKFDELHLDQTYTARELIDIIRARTFPPHAGAYFVADDGSKVYLRLQLQYEEQLKEEQPILQLREVCEGDCKLFYEWANDPDVRAASFLSGPISVERHQEWFQKKLKDPQCQIFVGLDEHDAPVGQIRFEFMNHEEAEAGMSVDRAHRGRGYGSLLVDAGSTALFCRTGVKTIHAFIKPWHQSSLRMFSKANFEKVGTKVIKGVSALHFLRRRP